MGKRLSRHERTRRDAAYLVWRRHNGNYEAAAGELGIELKELRRWGRVHDWSGRWIEEYHALEREAERIGDETDRLLALIEGVPIGGQAVFIPEEVRLLASLQAVHNAFSFAARNAELELLRDSMLSRTQGMLVDIVDMVHGVDSMGRVRPERGPEVRLISREILVFTGLVDDEEITTMSHANLKTAVQERLQQRGFMSGPQA